MTLNVIEILLILFVSIGVPIIAHLAHLYTKKQKDSGNPNGKRNDYILTMLILWIPTLLVIGYWENSGYNFSTIGLSFETEPTSYIGFIVSIALSLVFIAQFFLVKYNKKSKDAVLSQFENSSELKSFLPATQEEYFLFKLVSVTAGITEEILFRGFLIWGFSAFMNLWLASALALLSFTLGHLYQGSIQNLLKVAGTGAVLTGLYIASGSLLPSILVHIVIDLVSGAVVWEAQKNQPKPKT